MAHAKHQREVGLPGKEASSSGSFRFLKPTQAPKRVQRPLKAANSLREKWIPQVTSSPGILATPTLFCATLKQMKFQKQSEVGNYTHHGPMPPMGASSEVPRERRNRWDGVV